MQFRRPYKAFFLHILLTATVLLRDISQFFVHCSKAWLEFVVCGVGYLVFFRKLKFSMSFTIGGFVDKFLKNEGQRHVLFLFLFFSHKKFKVRRMWIGWAFSWMRNTRLWLIMSNFDESEEFFPKLVLSEESCKIK